MKRNYWLDPFLRNHQCRKDFVPFQINIQNRTCLSQGTGHSEHPHYSIKLCVDDNGRWEKTIHNILTIRGKKANTPGDEWFNTNPEEVLEIIRFIDPTIKNLP